MGFGHRVYRAEDPRARLLKGTAKELGSPRYEVAYKLEQAALAALRKKSPDRPLETNVEFWSAVVLDVADVPPQLAPAMFACSRTAGWSAHILEQKKLNRLVRPSAQYVGPASAPGLVDRMTLAGSRAAGRRARGRGRRARARDAAAAVGRGARARGPERRLPRPRPGLPRDRAVPLPPEARAACGAGSQDESPAARGSALIALEGLSRDHPGDVNGMRRAAARARVATTRTWPCAGSRSSASRTARRSARRS